MTTLPLSPRAVEEAARAINPEDEWERKCDAAREHGSKRPPYPDYKMKSDLRKAIKLIRKLRRHIITLEDQQ